MRDDACCNAATASAAAADDDDDDDDVWSSVIAHDIMSVSSMSVDWLRHTLYWVDSGKASVIFFIGKNDWWDKIFYINNRLYLIL